MKREQTTFGGGMGRCFARTESFKHRVTEHFRSPSGDRAQNLSDWVSLCKMVVVKSSESGGLDVCNR